MQLRKEKEEAEANDDTNQFQDEIDSCDRLIKYCQLLNPSKQLESQPQGV